MHGAAHRPVVGRRLAAGRRAHARGRTEAAAAPERSRRSAPPAGRGQTDTVAGQPVRDTSARQTTARKADEKGRGPADEVVGAAKGVTKKLRAGADAVVDDFVLVLIGLLTLSSALLGAFVIYRSRQHLLR